MFGDIIVKIKELLSPERKMINEVITVYKFILVIPTSSAARERPFSTARRLKTWLHSTMTQERFSNLKTLKSYKERTEDFLLVTLQMNLQIATVTVAESEILVFLQYLMYSKYQPLSYYFTVLLYSFYTPLS